MTVFTVSCEAFTKHAFRRHMAELFGRPNVRGLVLLAPYDMVEYLNSPAGLIVLAHHNTIDGQIDGVHPSTLSDSIDRPANIVEPLRDTSKNYNVHYMTRRSQGSLILRAFGRMIDQGDPAAPRVKTDTRFTLEIFSLSGNPIVAVIEEGTDRVYIIQLVESSELSMAEA